MDKKKKIIKIVAIVCISLSVVLSVVLGCVFGIKCNVTLVYPNGYSTRTETVTRGSTFAPPTGYVGIDYIVVGWYKDVSCTIPWLSTDKITSDITLYAKLAHSDLF